MSVKKARQKKDIAGNVTGIFCSPEYLEVTLKRSAKRQKRQQVSSSGHPIFNFGKSQKSQELSRAKREGGHLLLMKFFARNSRAGGLSIRRMSWLSESS